MAQTTPIAARGAARDASRRKEDLDAERYEVYCTECGAAAEVLPITEATPPNPLEIYGASKYMQELCLRNFNHSAVHILRLSSVYGQRLRLDVGKATIIARLAGWIRCRHWSMFAPASRHPCYKPANCCN
jgi:hypothetical protein